MTILQKLQIKASEQRARLNEIAGLEGDALTDEVRAEEGTLQTEFRDTETKLRAAIASDPGPVETRHADSPEVRELRALISGADVGAIFEAVLEHRQTAGREAEIQEHYGVQSNQVPLALLRGRGPVEHRATGVTAAPGDVGVPQSEIIPAVFPQGCAAFLGVDMPTVDSGEAAFPVLTTSADAGTPAENASQDETAGAFTADLLPPARIQAAFFYSREDRARFRGMGEALRLNLDDALSDKLDQQILNGPKGLLHSTNLANHKRVGRERLREVPVRLRVGARRRQVCELDGRSSDRHGLGRLRARWRDLRRHGDEQGRLERNREADGRDRRRQGLGSCAGRRFEQAERHHPARDAARRGGRTLGGRHVDPR